MARRFNRSRALQDTLQGYRTNEAMPLEDVCFATLLSELVYRAADCTDDAAFRQAQAAVEQELGTSLNHVRQHKSGGQRYLVGETDDAMYVAFQGTKSATDWLANLNFFHGHFGLHQHQHQHQGLAFSSSSASLASSASASSGSSSDSDSATTISSSSGSSGVGRSRSSAARAHIGFLRRANSAAVSISSLHASAAAAGKRLVLTGHSLGGAVAVLTTVRLLRALTGGAPQHAASSTPAALLDDAAEPRIRCISFATPAVANTQLLQEVTAAGWDQFITNIVMPEDPVVPFVNLLLKVPTASSHPNPSHRGLFRGSSSSTTSSSSISSSISGSSAGAASPALTRSSSSDSTASLDSQGWEASLAFEPMALPADLGASLVAAAAADDGPWALPLQELAYAHSGPATAGTHDGSPPSPTAAAAAAADQLGGGGSRELESWLAAAQGAVRARRHSSSQAPSPRSFGEGSRFHSTSGASLQSGLWPLNTCSDAGSSGSGSPLGGYGRSQSDSGMCPAAVLSFAMGPLQDQPSTQDRAQGSAVGALGQGLAAVLAAAQQAQQQQQQQARPQVLQRQQQQRPPLRNQVMQQVKRLQQQLRGSSTTRLAWISGALVTSLRCAAALAAPGAAAAAGPQLSLLALLPRALAGPVALAALHFVGHAAYKAAMPPSHPLGQQWVMTGAGLELVAKPLASYPRNGESLGLRELGGLFPGHRMIAYRRRLAALVSQR